LILRLSMSTDPESRTGFGPYLEGVGPTYLDNGEVRVIRFGEIADLERALELHGKNVAAFLVEPIQGEAGYAFCIHMGSLPFTLILNSGLLSHPLGIWPKCTSFARSMRCY